MEDIRWEDPPPIRGSGPQNPWVKRLQPLTEQPKRWAVIHVCRRADAASKMAYTLRTGTKLPPGQWEFASRAVEGEARVYARYLGPDENGGES